eukprot:1159615-Pelagomonas_calceolata.AAC.4
MCSLATGTSVSTTTSKCRCRTQTVKSHKKSSSQQKKGTAWMRKQKDRADWQAHCDKAAEYKAQGHGHTADPQLRVLLALVFKHMVKLAKLVMVMVPGSVSTEDTTSVSACPAP